METYYFKQINRHTGEVVGYISYNGFYPDNDDEDILLEEISPEEFGKIISAIMQADEQEEAVEAAD